MRRLHQTPQENQRQLPLFTQSTDFRKMSGKILGPVHFFSTEGSLTMRPMRTLDPALVPFASLTSHLRRHGSVAEAEAFCQSSDVISLLLNDACRCLPEACVLHLGFFQDRNVGIGVFPQREKILICGLRFGGIALHSVGSADLEACECARKAVFN